MKRYRSLFTLTSLALVACGTHHDTLAGDQEGPQQDASVSGASGGFSGAGALGGAGDGAGAGPGASDDYRVAIHARATVLCPGECTELTAEAMNGRAPYAYAWSDQLGEGAGPHRACPESTTTFTVTARDTAIEGDEFERPSRSAEATIGIIVDDSDALGCAPRDAGPPPEPGVTTVQCSFPITYESSSGATPLILLESGTTLATDAQGNLYFAGTFRGVIDLGSGPTQHHVTDSGFVAKYDASCNPVWIRTFGGALEANVELRALDVAPDGTVVAGGKLGGTLELDGQTLSPRRPSLLMLSLDGADGTVTRATTYESPYGDGTIFQLAVDGAGEIVFGGQTGGNFVIDGVTVEGPELEGLVVFLAKVSATGQYRFGYQVTGSDVSHFAVRDDGTIAITSWAWINVQLGPAAGILPLESSGTHRFVVLLDADGIAKWGHSLDSLAGWSDTTWPPGTVAFDPDGNVLVEHGNLGTLESIGDIELSERLSKYDGSGELIWSRAVSPSGWRSNKSPEGSIATDSHGNIVQTLELPNHDEATPSGFYDPPDHVMVQKLRPDGTVIWLHTFATDVYENAFGVTIAPDDSIWVGHGVDTGYRPYEGTLRISKLAP